MKMSGKQFHKNKKKTTRKKNRKIPSLSSSSESILDLLVMLNVTMLDCLVAHPQTIISKIVHFLFLEENWFLFYKM